MVDVSKEHCCGNRAQAEGTMKQRLKLIRDFIIIGEYYLVILTTYKHPTIRVWKGAFIHLMRL